jgi:Xaa-Pro aminopeptidase
MAWWSMSMIKEKEYLKRRKKLAKKLKNNSITLVSSALPKLRSNDTHYPYRQNSNFYYLTGFDEDSAALLIVKTKEGIKTILFVQQKDPQLELWNGKRLGVKKAKKTFKVDKVYGSEKFEEVLKKYLQQKHTAYYQYDEQSDFIDIFKKQTKNFYTHKDISKKIQSLRSIKSKAEIKLIKKALHITKKAHHSVMQMKKAGLKEYELQARIEYIFKKHGAYSDAYTTIVASGDNANTLHYIKNSDTIKKDDLILIDAGCEYKYYASDITRTIPATTMSKAQQEVYALVLATQKEVIKLIKEGVLRSTLHKKSQELLCEGLIKLGILKGKKKKLLKQDAIKKYYPHGIGHFMGLDVHDQNRYKTKKNKEIPLKKGMVLTIEPGIYLPKNDRTIPKKYRGIGIRIEDNILVTKTGYKNLSKGIAKELADIC